MDDPADASARCHDAAYPVFAWSQLVTCLMVAAEFPALLGSMVLLALWRIDPALFGTNAWNLGYENLSGSTVIRWCT